VVSSDAEWYDAVLDECSSLDVNDFLHNPLLAPIGRFLRTREPS
jgi:hypothetical protein